MTPVTPPAGGTQFEFLLGFLTQFDTSKTERLKIVLGNRSSSEPLYRALLRMEDLRTLALSRCINLRFFIHALHPRMSPSGVVVCPKLEELTVEPQQILDIGAIARMAAAREARGAKLNSSSLGSLVLWRLTCWSSRNTFYMWNGVPRLMELTVTAMMVTRKIEEGFRDVCSGG